MQDDTELSYAVKLLGDADNPTHIQCVECRCIKPIKDYKYKCTLAQAQSLGRQQPFDFTAKSCKSCRKKKEKPLHKLSLKQIQNKISSGQIKGGVVGELIKENRVADGIRRKREGQQRRWKTTRFEMWEGLFEDTTLEYARVRKNKSLNKPNTPQHTFFTAYCTAIVEVRRYFKLEAKMGRRSTNKGSKWWLFMGAETRQRLLKLWENIPFADRHSLKMPEIFEPLLTEGEPQ